MGAGDCAYICATGIIIFCVRHVFNVFAIKIIVPYRNCNSTLQIEEIEEKNCNLSLNIVKYNRLYL